MLTEQEIMNNALKEMLYMEEMTSQKYAQMSEQITEQKIKDMLKGMEMAARNNHKSISQKMSDMAIV